MSKMYLQPSEKGRREPTDNTQDRGFVVNPPRFAKMGGLSGASKGPTKNAMTIKKPGNTRG